MLELLCFQLFGVRKRWAVPCTYLDWEGSYASGEVTVKECEATVADLSEAQKIVRAYSCSGFDAAEELPTAVYVEAYHDELGGIFAALCDLETHWWYIDGMCVGCDDELCVSCALEGGTPICQ